MVNYNDIEWIRKFITEVLTDADFSELVRRINTREFLAKKLGYKKIGQTFAYVNEKGFIEEDENMTKLFNNIEWNEIYKARFLKHVDAYIKKRTLEKSDEPLYI